MWHQCIRAQGAGVCHWLIVTGPWRIDTFMVNCLHMAESPLNKPGLANGVYSYREAARLLNVTSQRVTRWADGYVFKLKLGSGQSRPILQTDRHQGVLSFAELIELFFVREYIGLGVQLQHIRATAEALAAKVGPYPFSRSELLVGGRLLFVEQAEGILERPDIGQLVADFAETITPRLRFDKGEAERYFPPEFDEHIYLDKSIRGGEAVITEFAIPTRMIYALWEAERELLPVAEYFEIKDSDVSIAIRYEGQWRLAA